MEDLNSFIESLPMPLFIIQQDLVVLCCNQKAQDLTDHNWENREITEIFPVLKTQGKHIKAALKNNIAQTITKIALLGAEREKYWDIIICPLQNHELHKGILVCEDITDKINYQALIIHNEKFAALGMLLAGVAHEINNPINYISANINPLKNDLNDLILILNKYAEIMPGKDLIEKLKEINNIKEELDINYLLEEMPKLIEGINDGARKTAEIVKGLRVYSRSDENHFQKGNINEAIESSLIILRHNYKDRINIVRELSDIPEIECMPGKINQIFMNLLANAIQAIEGKGEIHIKTEHVDNKVKIYIKDSGSGISRENKDKIFKSFFTTKERSIGTGLGLTITLSIIQDHNGKIEFNSQPGKGTEFIVTLPLNQP